jgi:hypothetical protein
MQNYKELANENKSYIDYATGEAKDGYYLIPFMDSDNKISYYTAEAVHKKEVIGNFEIPKYRKIKGLESKLFNQRYIESGEQYIFITERNLRRFKRRSRRI